MDRSIYKLLFLLFLSLHLVKAIEHKCVHEKNAAQFTEKTLSKAGS